MADELARAATGKISKSDFELLQTCCPVCAEKYRRRVKP